MITKWPDSSRIAHMFVAMKIFRYPAHSRRTNMFIEAFAFEIRTRDAGHDEESMCILKRQATSWNPFRPLLAQEDARVLLRKTEKRCGGFICTQRSVIRYFVEYFAASPQGMTI